MPNAPETLPAPFLVGLCGLAGSGKSHVAKAMHENAMSAGTPCVVLAFATPIKLMLEALLRTHMTAREAHHYLNTEDGKRTPLDLLQGRTPRQAMQTLGTEWGRTLIGPNIWIDVQMKHAQVYLAQGVSVIFDDVRFPSETAAIRDAGGEVIHVFNPYIHSEDAHISERLPPFDRTFENAWVS